MNWNNEEAQDGNELVMDFDTAAVAPSVFDVIPEGEYPVRVGKVAVKMNRSGTGKTASIQLTILDGDYKGRTVYDNLTVVMFDADNDPKKAQAQQIGRAQLAALLAAVGKAGENNLANIIDKECFARVKVQSAQGEWEARNIVRGYKSLAGAHVAPKIAAPAPQQASVQQAPVQQQQQAKGAPSFMQRKPTLNR